MSMNSKNIQSVAGVSLVGGVSDVCDGKELWNS